MKKLFLVALLPLFLAGCSANQGPGGDHSVSWYKKHTKAREAEIRWCGNQSADVQKSVAGCEQAKKAASELLIGGMFSGFNNDIY